MGNISFCVSGVLKKIKQNKAVKETVKSCFVTREQKYIERVQIKRDILIVYVNSAAALYEFNIKKQEINQKIQKQIKGIKTTTFKLGK